MYPKDYTCMGERIINLTWEFGAGVTAEVTFELSFERIGGSHLEKTRSGRVLMV